MLAFAICGGTYAISKMHTADKVKFGFTIGLIAAYKKKGITLSEEEEKSVKVIEDELNAQLAEFNKGYISAEDFQKKVDELSKQAQDSTKIMIGEGDKAKSIDQLIRDLGTSVAELKISEGKEKTKTFNQLLDDNLEAIEKIFLRKSGHVTISLKAAAIMTTANTIDASVITGNDGTDVTDNFRVDAFVPKRQDRQYIFDIADRVTVAEVPEYIIWEEEGDSQGNVALVSQGAVKPLVSFENVKNMSEYKKAAGKMVITEEFQKFKQRRYAIIRTLFNEKVLRDYQNQLTTYLLAAAASYIGTTLDGQFTNPTDFHAIGAVAAQLETLNYAPDTLIINPQDKWRIALQQDDQGRFFTNIPITGANGQVQMMSFRTITTNKMTVGSFMLGEGGLYKIEEEAVQIRIGYGVTMNGGTAESDFDYNRLRIIGELFFHNYIASNNAGSFVVASFSDVKEALTAAQE